MNMPIRTKSALRGIVAPARVGGREGVRRAPCGDPAMDARVHSPHRADDADSASRLQAWDAEDGADNVRAPARAAPAASLTAQQRRLLARLGAALVHEWSHLPMPLQRAIYRRAVRGALDADPSALARPMARFLHDHQERRSR
jgi:hypothetical protein